VIKIHSKRILAASVIAAALIGASATSAVAAPQKNGSDSPVYLYDAGSSELFDENDVHAFDYDVIGVPSPTDIEARFQCGADAETVRTFVSPVGKERDMSSWIAWANIGFIPESNKEIQQYPMTISGNGNGSVLSVKAAGGAYSAGIACLKYNDVAFASSGLWFSTIDVTPVTGAWTARAVDSEVVVPRRPSPHPRAFSAFPFRPAPPRRLAPRPWSTACRPRPVRSARSR
jgi:hypothetical protein